VSAIRIIHIETATTTCSVAAGENGVLVAVRSVHDGYKHAENLLRLVEEVMQEAGWKNDVLSAIAVSAGPGSYTGLRIGVSTAKGLCYGLDIPLIAVSTLYSLASGFRRQFSDSDVLLCPMLDARRMEVYTALFSKNLERLKPDAPLIVESLESVPEILEQPIVFFGDGAEKCEVVLAHQNATFNNLIQISAEDMIKSAFDAFQSQSSDSYLIKDLAYFEPEYLKPYQGKPPVMNNK
jgi:tRNA threonylcarbamoyladenosine biosynthesis protein TsaB